MGGEQQHVASMTVAQARCITDAFERTRAITDQMMEAIDKGGCDWRKHLGGPADAELASCMDAMARLDKSGDLGYAIHEGWELLEDNSIFNGPPYQRLKRALPPYEFETVEPRFSQAEAVLVDMTALLRKHMQGPCVFCCNDQTIRAYLVPPRYAMLVEEVIRSLDLIHEIYYWEIEHNEVYSFLGSPSNGKRVLRLNAGVPLRAYRGFSKDLEEFFRKWHATQID